MRIIHVLHSHGYGGAENHALTRMAAQAQAGHEVLYAGRSDSWLAQRCQAAGIQTHALRMAGLFDPASHLSLRRLVARWAPDIVHGHMVRGAFYAGWAASAHRGSTAICTAHATTARKHMGRCRHIIAVSNAVAANLLAHGQPRDKVSVVHNGIPDLPTVDRDEVRRQLGIPQDVFAVVNVGRFVRDKGQDLLVQALSRCPAHVHLYFVGEPDTDFGQHIKAQAQGQARIHFLGYRGDVPQLMAAFDAYASASRREALGLSLVEAAAAHLPTVATAVGGVPEVVLDGLSGILVPSEDVDAIARGIEALVLNPSQAQAMGRAAREHYLRQFTLDSMFAGTQAVYRLATGSRAP
ncbi:MAG: glycosyltransferase [Pseudomonadota bacterium]